VITKFPAAFSVVGLCLLAASLPPAQTWRFDSISRIAGHNTTVLGHPQVISTPAGKAIQFNGVDDAVFLDVHPLAGAETWTWEVIFRPDADGSPEQRFFHLQENGTDNRLLFEIRLIPDKAMVNQWCLDSFAKSGDASLALMDRAKLHPAGAWYHAAAVYDGHEFRNYVDGVLEGKGDLHLTPHGRGRTSIGVRINKVNYFKGAVRMARMTPRALAVSEFLRK
jgi:hypothetical protein